MDVVKILGITIGGQEKDKVEGQKVCNHPVLQRGMKYNPEKQAMEVFCKKCGQVVEENR